MGRIYMTGCALSKPEGGNIRAGQGDGVAERYSRAEVLEQTSESVSGVLARVLLLRSSAGKGSGIGRGLQWGLATHFVRQRAACVARQSEVSG